MKKNQKKTKWEKRKKKTISKNIFFRFFKFQSRQKGQSLVETLILSLALIMIIKWTLIVFWIWTSVLWMEHQLYQGIVCTAQQKEVKQCKQTVLRQIKKLNPLGKIKSLNIKKFQNEWKGYIQWHFYKKDFFIKQTLSLPQ